MCESGVAAEEYVNWRDCGCELHPACLECPLPHCIEEQPRGRQHRRMQARALAMRNMRLAGRSATEVAVAFGVSVRTVQRELKRNGDGNNNVSASAAKQSSDRRTEAGGSPRRSFPRDDTDSSVIASAAKQSPDRRIEAGGSPRRSFPRDDTDSSVIASAAKQSPERRKYL